MGFRALELCEGRGGRPGLPVPNSPFGLCGRKATLNSNLTNIYIYSPFVYLYCCTMLPLARMISAKPIVSERAKYMKFMKRLYTVTVPGSKIVVESFVDGQKVTRKTPVRLPTYLTLKEDG